MSAPSTSDQEKLKKLKTLQAELAQAFAQAKKYTSQDTQVFKRIEDLLNEIGKLTEPEKKKK